MNWLITPAFERRVKALLDEHHVPGLAIAIVKDDITISAGYGLASIEPPIKCTSDTLFDIASASKSITGAAIGLLIADEQYPNVHYEALVSNILPEDFVMPTEELTGSVSLEDILTHRTSLASHDESYMGQNAARPDTAASVTRNLRNLQMAAPLRTKYMYCNMMFTVASYVVEKCTKMTFSEFLEQRFFSPLGMTSSSLQPSRARAKGFSHRMATGYAWNGHDRGYIGFQSPDCDEGQGTGSIVTSVNDYIKWIQTVMKRQEPIATEIYNGLMKSRNVANPEHQGLLPFTSPTFIGIGWEVEYYRGRMIVSHDGAISGFASMHFFLPELQFGGVLFGNSEAAHGVIQVLMHELIDEALNIPSSERLDWNEVLKDNRAVEGDGKDDPMQLRQELCADIGVSNALSIPLDEYTGEYWNVGYHGMKVKVKDQKLFIDATDRSFSFTATFEHVCGGDKFLAYLTNVPDGDVVPIKAGFKIEGNKVLCLGLHLAEELDEFIWFDKVIH